MAVLGALPMSIINRYFFSVEILEEPTLFLQKASGAMVAQVYSDAAQCDECVISIGNGLGFKIRYNINAGNC